MKAAVAVSLLLLTILPSHGGLGDARKFLQRNEPAKAAELIAALLVKTPNDPWLLYNAGIAAYAAKDYAKADAYWQKLASMEMPEQLRDQVWLQIGNVSYRQGEPLVTQQPDSAVAKLEQSREAYRIAIASQKEEGPAKQNLVFVEKQLEKLYAQLASQLVENSKKEDAPERAIEKLLAALDYQRNATALNPKEPQHAKAERAIEQMLAERFVQKAEQSEKQGDRIADQKTLDQWKLDAAQQEFDKARADFRQAQTFDSEKQEAKQGEQRVIEKMANMLAKAGRQELKEGTAKVKGNPAQAMESFEQSLQHFEDALAAMPNHQDALAGSAEVKQAMEQLHLQQGDKMAKTGEEQIEKNPAEAAENLLGALDHFQQAKGLNPDNPTIPPRIERVEKLLPEALMAMAEREQKRAADAEKEKAIANAVAHLERADAGYDKVQQLQVDNQKAKENQKQVQDDLARLRKLLAQEPTPRNQQQSSRQQQQQEDQPSFESMLAQVKAKQDPREVNMRMRAGVKYDPSKNPGLRNW